MQTATISIGTSHRRPTKRSSFLGEEEDDDDWTEENVKFDWSNLIFIPFNEVFMLLLLVSVICKTIMGPLTSISPELYCIVTHNDTAHTVLSTVKPYFSYICDPVFVIDFFLHIVHKQVEEKAKQREYLPKSTLTILLDICAIIPFYRLTASSDCGEVALWPNILCFNEFLLIYRVIDFFYSGMKHSIVNHILGSLVIGLIGVNAISCFWLLLTYQGFCKQCKTQLLDWRFDIQTRLDAYKTNEEKFFLTYFSATGFFLSILFQTIINGLKPILMTEIMLVNVITALSYLIVAFFVIPKLFAESCLLNSKEFRFQRQVIRVLKDTSRRTSDPNTISTLYKSYHLIWIKRNGITRCPKIIRELPRYLSTDIKDDLCWPLFYHSPTLRRTSIPFKRWICDYMRFEYKMPGEIFYHDRQCCGNIYYVKSGIVQLISSDDSVTPLLSVTGGTILGDVNFYVPALGRKILVRCLTYCEVYSLTRRDIYSGMQNFPKDQKIIMYKVKQRLKHARDLYAIKKRFAIADRTEKENLNWLKTRWWKIFNIVQYAKKKNSALSEIMTFEIPPEENIYHCSKFIGQLVLCNDTQLQDKSTFVTAEFPWIFVPDSTFSITWHRIVKFTVYVVLFIYPPTLINSIRDTTVWFLILQSWVDFTFVIDICLKLITAPPTKEADSSFTVVMFTRCKQVEFLLDLLATPLIDEFIYLSELRKFETLCKFNRLIKIYVLFKTTDMTKMNIKESPLIKMAQRKIFIYFSFIYISCFFVFVLCFNFQFLSHMSFFCYLPKRNDFHNALQLFISWMRDRSIYQDCIPTSYHDIYVIALLAILGFFIKMHTKSHMIGVFFLDNIEYIKYQFFVAQLTKKYASFKIHPTLIKRVNKYIECHWISYNGFDLMCNELVHDQPHNVYWKCHGETATKIVSQSAAFLGCDEEMIKEIAFRSKFVIYPKNSLLYLYGCPFEKVAWLVNGSVACEYPDATGNITSQLLPQGEVISVIGVFFGKFSIRTFVAATDVEILYLMKRDFFDIMKRYPREMEYFKSSIQKIRPAFEAVYYRHINDVKFEFQRNVRQRIFAKDVYLADHARVIPDPETHRDAKTFAFFLKYRCWIHPQSKYYQRFILFRIGLIFVTIILSTVQAGSAAYHRHWLWQICQCNDYVTYLDMLFKVLLAHYNDKGLIIYSWKKRFMYYFTHTFAADLIGSVPWYRLTNYLIPDAMNQSTSHFFDTCYRCFHIYLINGYFNYMAYWPTSNLVYIMIIKWNLILVLVIVAAAQFYMIQCVDISWSKSYYITSAVFTNDTCWISRITRGTRPSLEGRNLTQSELGVMFAESLLIATHSLMRTSISRFRYHLTSNYLLMAISWLLGIMHWFVMTYIIALLVLNSRGHGVFLDSITQLENFLKGERIEDTFIKSVTEHYKYVWFRTKGIYIQTRLITSIGSILRQDLSYYFFKETMEILDSQLHIGSSLKWTLAFYCNQLYFLEKADIMREDDVVQYVYIVHRGAVTIFQNNKRLATLEKGSIFGQLESTRQRPVKVTATARDNTDILVISWHKFQELLTEKARQNIESERSCPQDYISIISSIRSDPYNSVGYLLKESKTISYPWMKKNTCNIKTSRWYSYWLILVWLVEPFLSISCSLLTVLIIPPDVEFILIIILAVLDFIFLVQFVSDYIYGVELVISGNISIFKPNRLRKLRHLGLYTDLLSVLLPNCSLLFSIRWLQIARLLRIRLLYLFYHQFVVTFQSRAKPLILFFVCIILFIHTLACMHIAFECHYYPDSYYLDRLPEKLFNILLDVNEWTIKGREIGCPCIIRDKPGNITNYYEMRTKNWYGDYLLAISNIVQIMSILIYAPNYGIYKHEIAILIKALVNLSLLVLDILIISKAVSVIHIKFRKLYKYDKTVTTLLSFLSSEDLSPTLQEIVKTYMKQLWDRQRGNWLPELAYQAPQCLREDIMGTLYIHHLHKPRIFHEIPQYFLRQLVSRFHRVVIFPGQYIVRTGDVLPRLYFIHEGDVEKHYVNSKGEVITTHLLTTNGYFGFIPGMPSHLPFICSYFTRTVVDAVYIQVEEWKELLDVYDDVKNYLFSVAQTFKNEL